LAWYYQGTNGTDIYYFDNASPWATHQITSYSNVDPQDTSLPVQLSAFSAEGKNGVVILKWRTESEIGSLGFNVHRSRDREGVYLKVNLELIPAYGVSTNPQEYTYTDDQVEARQTYYYKLEQVDTSGQSAYYGPIMVFVEGRVVPDEFVLQQNYPNPFNSTTKISYGLPEQSHVLLQLFNVPGEVVRTLVNAEQDAGVYEMEWDGADTQGRYLSSGIYFCKLDAGAFRQVKKMVYTR